MAKPGSRFSGVATLLVVIAPLGWALYVHATAPILPYDDAFITYRYVDHLVQGKGLVYNEGERVFGSTTPLYLLLLASLRSILDIPTPTLAVRLNGVFFACSGLLVWVLLRRITASAPVAAFLAAALLVDPYLLAFSTGGMESSLFVALVLCGFLALTHGKGRVFGWVAGLATLTRPEGLLLLPWGALRFRSSKREMAWAAMSFALPVSAWALFAVAYFGTVIPLSLVAKAKPLYPLDPGTALVALTDYLSHWTAADPLPGEWLRAAIDWGVVLGLGGASLVDGDLRRRGSWCAVAFLWTLAAAYGAGNPMFFEWYWPMFQVALLLATGTGIVAVARLLGSPLARRTLWAAAAAWIALVSLGPYLHTGEIRTPELLVRRNASRLRVSAYEAAAQEINRVAGPSDVALATEIGSFGYSFRGKVLDSCGLVSPEAHRFLPVPKELVLGPGFVGVPERLVLETRPEWVVTMPLFASRSLLRSGDFARTYEQYRAIPLPLECWGNREILIFRRKLPPESR